jgi:hypothetical protein
MSKVAFIRITTVIIYFRRKHVRDAKAEFGSSGSDADMKAANPSK